jgi:FixJ family two-component response regulator
VFRDRWNGSSVPKGGSPKPATRLESFSPGRARWFPAHWFAREYAETPIVVVADYEDIPTAVQAIKAGAIDFLVKPIIDEMLLPAIRHSLARSHAALDRWKEMHELRQCYGSLSPREQQVMALVVSGLLNKQVGAELGISEITVKAHRGQVMQKMKAASFAHLVNMGTKLRITSTVISNVA